MPVVKNESLDPNLLVPHPANPNRMQQAERDRLRKHIAETNLYPAIVVRSLEESEEFTEDFKAGRYQILDGEHRWMTLKDLGASTVRCEVWPGITDARALILIATLNHGGSDDPERRAAVVKRIYELTQAEINEMAAMLPEDEVALRKYLEITDDERAIIAGATQAVPALKNGRAPAVSQEHDAQYLSFFCHKDQRRKIKTAMEKWLEQNDPGGTMAFRDGVALVALMGLS